MDLAEFKAKYQALSFGELDKMLKTDSGLVVALQELYRIYFGVLSKTCSNCLHDAYILLMNLKQNKEMEAKKGALKFDVKAGTFVYDPICLDSSQILTPANLFKLGNDLALRHIIHAKRDLSKYFTKQPDEEQLKRLIAEYKSRVEGDSTELDALTALDSPVPSNTVAQTSEGAEGTELEGLELGSTDVVEVLTPAQKRAITIAKNREANKVVNKE